MMLESCGRPSRRRVVRTPCRLLRTKSIAFESSMARHYGDTRSPPRAGPRRRTRDFALPTGRVGGVLTTETTANGLRSDLAPVVAELFDRHLETTREWFPHELVPWSQGRDFVPGEAWDAGQSQVPVSHDARVALVVNLLTEDNLPYYSATLGGLGSDGPWGEWMRRWTAEEGRHAIVIRDYLTVTRLIDPVALERGRMVQVAKGVVPEPGSVPDMLAYVSLQELATRISHNNTGRLL